MADLEINPRQEITLQLITNIEFVGIALNGTEMRLACHALLLEKTKSLVGNNFSYKIRGFGTDGAWPIFEYWLKCRSLEYRETETEDNSHVILNDEGKARPLFKGATLVFEDDSEFFLQTSDQKQPLDKEDFSDITEVWKALPAKVKKYWQFPNFPLLQYIRHKRE